MAARNDEAQARARELYLTGEFTYNQLARTLGVAKSSLSLWLRDLAQPRLQAQMVATAARRRQQAETKSDPGLKRTSGEGVFADYWLWGYVGLSGETYYNLRHKVDRSRLHISRGRYALSNKLGRLLASHERMRYVDGNRDNLEPDNLVLRERQPKPVVSRPRRADLAARPCVICEEPFKPRRPSVETCSMACKSVLIGAMRSYGKANRL